MRVASLMAACLLAVPGWAQSPERGQTLYATHCGGCHYERVHQRPQSRWAVKSLVELRVEVARWAAQVKRPFTAEDLDDLAAYLNDTHYRFPR